MLTELINQIYKNIPISSPNVHFEIYECAIQRVLKIEVNPPATFEEIRPIDTEGAAVIEDETPGEINIHCYIIVMKLHFICFLIHFVTIFNTLCILVQLITFLNSYYIL